MYKKDFMKKSRLEKIFLVLWLILPAILFLPSGLLGLIYVLFLISGLMIAIKDSNFELFIGTIKGIIFALIITLIYFIPTILIFLIRRFIRKKYPKKLKIFYIISIIVVLLIIIAILIHLKINGMYKLSF